MSIVITEYVNRQQDLGGKLITVLTANRSLSRTKSELKKKKNNRQKQFLKDTPCFKSKARHKDIS